MRYSERPSCYAAVNAADTRGLFEASRHFCRTLRLDRPGGAQGLYVGWVGDSTVEAGRLELSQPFATCLGLNDGDQVVVTAARAVPIARRIMVQPNSVDDWEVVEVQAAYLEEHFLAQIAVLTPGMVFPVWVHGRVAAKLKVDARDENRGECFLLDRDSELAIESRARAIEGAQPVAVLGGEKAAGAAEPSIRLRVLDLAEDIDAPVARVHAQDLEELTGVALPSGCLVWLTMTGRRPALEGSGPSTAGDAAAAAGAAAGGAHAVNAAAEGPSSRRVLLRIEPTAGVPRRHIVVGRCLAEEALILHFAIVRLSRALEVPVYVPKIELQPLTHIGLAADTGIVTDEDTRWLNKLFVDFVHRCKEICLADGSVIKLRSDVVPLPTPTSSARSASKPASSPALASRDSRELRLPQPNGASSVVPTRGNAAGEGDELSELNIDDLYAQSDDDDSAGSRQAVPADFECGFAPAAHSSSVVIDEVDLGLDEEEPWWDDTPDASPLVQARPDSVVVRVRFAIGASWRESAEVGVNRAAPFGRFSARSFANGVRVSVAAPQKSSSSRKGRVSAEVAAEPSEGEALARLWAAVPGLNKFPEQQWTDLLRIVLPPLDSNAAAAPLNEMGLYRVSADALLAHVLAQLGQRSVLGSAPTPAEGAQVKTCGVPGATAVVGAYGSGKTVLCQGVLKGLAGRGVLPLIVSCAKLGQPGRKFKAVLAWIRGIFRFACWYSPSVVLLDDFGALCPDVEQGAPNLSITEERSAIVAELLADVLRAVRAGGAQVAVVITAPGDANVHRSLWQAGVLEHKVPVRSPTLKERPEILRRLCRLKLEAGGWDVDSDVLHESALDDWGARVDGFSVGDLARLVDRACLDAAAEVEAGAGVFRSAPRLAAAHLERACNGFVASGMADQSFLASETRLVEIGGMAEAKKAIMDMLTLSSKYAALVDRAPVRSRRGLMLVGPPGCGKTMLVHAAARETKGLVRVLTVKGPELLSKYIGESEAGVRRIFERAAAASPSAIFFDEIEALAPKRGADSTGVTDRVVNQMLCYLDGVEDRGRVYVIAATGRPDMVDAALMRPGRFDKICYCGSPNDEERLQICEIQARRMGVEADQAQLRQLVARIPRLFTPADICALFSSAKVEAITEIMKGSGAPGDVPTVTLAHVCAALACAKPSVSEADDRRYAQLFAAYMPNVGPGGSGGGAAGSSGGPGGAFGRGPPGAGGPSRPWAATANGARQGKVALA